jgi:hypothetical protein
MMPGERGAREVRAHEQRGLKRGYRMKVLRLVRAIAVVIVPSLVLELLSAVSTVSTVRVLLSRARGDRNPPPLRPLALAGTIAPWLFLALVRPWHLRWGATDEEVSNPLPGDEMTPEPSAQSTHAITIEAPPEVVWPWLMQLGQRRGGWYSYYWLENLAGLEIHSREHVVPELRLALGDPVRGGDRRSSRPWPGASGRSSLAGL